MEFRNPTWEDLQKLGCSRIGRVVSPRYQTLPPVCSECKQDYYWSHATDEWVHPFEKEFQEYRKKGGESSE